jgi:hypothetical protein
MQLNSELGRYGTHIVRIRVDDQSPVAQSWSESTSGDSVFAPEPQQLAKLISAANNLAFEVTPFQSSAAVARFNVEGLDKLLDKVAVPCGWGKAQEAAAQRERVAKDQQRKARELEHLKQWALHVDLKAKKVDSAEVVFSADGGSRSRILIDLTDKKHINANEQVRLVLTPPDNPAQLSVIVNGKEWLPRDWKEEIAKDSNGFEVGRAYVALITPSSPRVHE